jgi:hypothetical protein
VRNPLRPFAALVSNNPRPGCKSVFVEAFSHSADFQVCRAASLRASVLPTICSLLQARSGDDFARRADLKIGDTADLEVCATKADLHPQGPPFDWSHLSFWTRPAPAEPLPFPKKPLPPSRKPGIAQKLPSAGLHVLDYQSHPSRSDFGSAPTPAPFIMHKGAQACINRPNLRASGRKSTRLDLPDARSQHQNRPTSVPSPRGRRLG